MPARVRCDAEQLPAEMRQPPGYHAFWHGSERKKGYSGTTLLTRSAPPPVRFGWGDPQIDDEAPIARSTWRGCGRTGPPPALVVKALPGGEADLPGA